MAQVRVHVLGDVQVVEPLARRRELRGRFEPLACVELPPCVAASAIPPPQTARVSAVTVTVAQDEATDSSFFARIEAILAPGPARRQPVTQTKPTGRLELPTPSLRVKCSTS